MIVTPGATSQTIQVQIVDDSGLPVTGLVAATFPSVYYLRAGETLPSAVTLSDLAAQNSSYSSGGVKELTGGYYRFDVPNAAFATASKVRIIGEASGKRLLYPPIQCEYVSTNLSQVLGTALNTGAASGYLPADTLKVGGTTQTARDIGASVLLSSGTGTGQILLTSGVVSANATQLAGQTVSASGTVTFPAATLASTANITTVGAVSGAVGSVTGDVNGKVIGGGSGTITGTGAWSLGASGVTLAPASTALSTATWTGTRAGYLDSLATTPFAVNVTQVSGTPVETADSVPATLTSESLAAILTQTVTELSAIPAASPTLAQAVALVYMALRNKLTVTASAKTIFKDDGTALGAKTLTDNGTTYTEAEMA